MWKRACPDRCKPSNSIYRCHASLGEIFLGGKICAWVSLSLHIVEDRSVREVQCAGIVEGAQLEFVFGCPIFTIVE